MLLQRYHHICFKHEARPGWSFSIFVRLFLLYSPAPAYIIFLYSHSSCLYARSFVLLCIMGCTRFVRNFECFVTKGKKSNYNAKYRKQEFCDDCLAINHCHQKYQNGNNHTNTILCRFTSTKQNKNNIQNSLRKKKQMKSSERREIVTIDTSNRYLFFIRSKAKMA